MPALAQHDAPERHAQLEQCANALRTSPASFVADINAVCSFAAFQAEVTSPPRPPFAANARLRCELCQAPQPFFAISP
jgi:hypothetical protein